MIRRSPSENAPTTAVFARPVRVTAALITLFLLAGALNACSRWGAEPIATSLGPVERAERIASLLEAIDLDHTRLEELITAQDSPTSDRLHEHPEIRTIAARIDDRRSEIRELETGR